jgi:hypothetical protein
LMNTATTTATAATLIRTPTISFSSKDPCSASCSMQTTSQLKVTRLTGCYSVSLHPFLKQGIEC